MNWINGQEAWVWLRKAWHLCRVGFIGHGTMVFIHDADDDDWFVQVDGATALPRKAIPIPKD